MKRKKILHHEMNGKNISQISDEKILNNIFEKKQGEN
jgi:hypothetical protein